MEFNRIYNRQEFVNFLQNSFLPEDFMSSTTPVEFRTKMKYTTQAIKLGSSDTLDLVVYEIQRMMPVFRFQKKRSACWPTKWKTGPW